MPMQTFVAGAEMMSTGTWRSPTPPNMQSGTSDRLTIIAAAPRIVRATIQATTVNNTISQNRPVTRLDATSVASSPCKR